MGTQVTATYNIAAPYMSSFGNIRVMTFECQLLDSGTTMEVTLPVAGQDVIGVLFWNKTTGELSAGGTYIKATGVYTSPTCAVNDEALVSFFVK